MTARQEFDKKKTHRVLGKTVATLKKCSLIFVLFHRKGISLNVSIISVQTSFSICRELRRDSPVLPPKVKKLSPKKV